MRLNPLTLAIATTLSATTMMSVYAQEGCQLLSGKEDIDIGRESVERCLPGNNTFQDQQWNLLNSGQDAFSARGGIAGYDLNLWWAHRLGVLGNGVKVAVVDDGLEIGHPDLVGNVRPGSRNVLNGSSDPTPTNKDSAHGTSVAGIIAAADNNFGVKGVAPRVRLQGFNYIAPGSLQLLSDALYALGGSPATQDNRVFNQSYGSTLAAPMPYNTLSEEQLDSLFESMMLKADGAAYVKSAGNAFNIFSAGNYSYQRQEAEAGLPFYNSNISSANTNFWNMVVSAINADGVRASYSSVGSNVFVTAPGGEYGSDSPAHITTDLQGCDRGYSRTNDNRSNRLHNNPSLDTNCDYNGVMNGTSAAAPNVTGSLALLMSAYPNLSVRDLRDVLAHTATRIDPDHPAALLNYLSEGKGKGKGKFNGKGKGKGRGGVRQVVGLEGWEKNAAGMWFSPNYGFGLIDINRALQRAATQAPLPPLVQLPWQKAAAGKTKRSVIPDVGSAPTRSSVWVGQSLNIEGVQVAVNLDHERLSDLLIELVSPAGTRSVLLNPQSGLIGQAIDKDAMGSTQIVGMRDFRMLSNKFYGEDSAGEWRLQVTDVSSAVRRITRAHRGTGEVSEISEINNANPGVLIDWSLRVLGH